MFLGAILQKIKAQDCHLSYTQKKRPSELIMKKKLTCLFSSLLKYIKRYLENKAGRTIMSLLLQFLSFAIFNIKLTRLFLSALSIKFKAKPRQLTQQRLGLRVKILAQSTFFRHLTKVNVTSDIRLSPMVYVEKQPVAWNYVVWRTCVRKPGNT